MAEEQPLKLGDLLVEYNFITQDQLEKALEHQRNTQSDKRLGEILVELDIIDESQLVQVLEFHLGIPHVDLSKFMLDPQLADMLPERIARRHNVVPLELDEGTLKVACADPSNIVAIDDIKRASRYRIEPLIASSEAIKRAIDELYMVEQEADEVIQSLDDTPDEMDQEFQLDELQRMVEDAPIVRLANLILNRGVQDRASDIHIEPFERNVKVRYRIDGVMVDRMTTPKTSQAALISRLKIMSNMDISERRKPQDGRINLKKGNVDWDMRVSTVPTIFGEKMVIRILDRMAIPTLDTLGFSMENEKAIREAISSPYGILLVTGPTGSGKSTTLFSALKELNKPDVNITTVEDPVEYILPGINQIQTNVKVGMTFANALRSILRQDPDIIMVGEIRDKETAGIAVNAALTGHLVLSTLHTNDAPSSVSRLLDMGVESFLISSTLVAVLAQRLVRRVCGDCRQKIDLDEDEKEFLAKHGFPLTSQYQGVGCKSCSDTGYRGRMAITEILTMDRDLRMLTNRGANSDELRQAALDKGMKLLVSDGMEKVRDGFTTVEEVLRVATY